MTKPGRRDNDDRNWKIVCGVDGCDVEWAGSIRLDAVQLHFTYDHPEWTEAIAFNTVWVGPGAAPVVPDNRAARRRQEKKHGKRGRN